MLVACYVVVAWCYSTVDYCNAYGHPLSLLLCLIDGDYLDNLHFTSRLLEMYCSSLWMWLFMATQISCLNGPALIILGSPTSAVHLQLYKKRRLWTRLWLLHVRLPCLETQVLLYIVVGREISILYIGRLINSLFAVFWEEVETQGTANSLSRHLCKAIDVK